MPNERPATRGFDHHIGPRADDPMQNETIPTEFLASALGLAVVGASVLFFALIWCRVFGKAGFHAATGLLMLVPVVNLVMMLVLAFTRWPVEREVRTLRGIKDAVRRADSDHLRRAA